MNETLHPRSQRVRVVLADDTAGIRLLLRMALEADGRFEVVGEASDGLQAIAVVERYRPEIVLLDMGMPVLDGLEALPRIRATAPDARVVVFSAFAQERLVDVATELGAVAYLEKGLDPSQLTERLIEIARGAA